MNALAPIIVDPLTGPSYRESDNDYACIVTRLGDAGRVIVCRDDLQWILQRRDGKRAGRARWAGVGYFLTREALLRASRALCARIDPAALAALGALPEHITVARVTAPAPVNDKLAALTEAEVALIDDPDSVYALRRDRRQDPEFVGLTARE